MFFHIKEGYLLFGYQRQVRAVPPKESSREPSVAVEAAGHYPAKQEHLVHPIVVAAEKDPSTLGDREYRAALGHVLFQVGEGRFELGIPALQE
jgi:hypothetical protein